MRDNSGTEQPENDYPQAEPERKRISLRLIGSLAGMSVLIFAIIAVLIVAPMPTPTPAADEAQETRESEEAAETTGPDEAQDGEPAAEETQEEAASETSDSQASALEEDIYGIVEGDMSQSIQISSIEEQADAYRIDIDLLSEPETYEMPERWTKIVCQRCRGVFQNHGIAKDICVWAKYSDQVCGKTCYSQDTEEFEFTRPEDL